jgi:hypothetical protein
VIDAQADRTHWRRWFWPIWLGIAAYLVWTKWGAIHWFALGDTDDNLRYAQVRALLAGQGWFDLRQYRIDPPGGISVHWSRLVDLPIAGLILLLKPVLGDGLAARWACAIAPLLAFGTALWGMMLAVRRLVDPWAFLLAPVILVCAVSSMQMWSPLRIDHHGWQLATLIVGVAGMADPERRRGGITAGLATATSLAIGLELLPYLAVTGALIALWWAMERDQAPRLFGYGVSLGAGAALGYLLFASYDNRVPRCDALTPVYLSTLVLAGALAAVLAALPAERRTVRVAAALVGGAALALFFATAWPQCLGRPEHLPPELERLWFSHINEAKPLYLHGWRVAFPTLVIPVVGVVGAAWSLWRARGTDRFTPWLLVGLLSLFSALLLFWQTRAGPASQMLGVIGATALGLALMRWTLAHRWMAVRVPGTVAVILIVTGAFAGLVLRFVPEKVAPGRRAVNVANRRCPTLPALAPVGALPPATILTFIDLGPRLIAVTHHRAVAGPYHRAGDAILDVQHSFRSSDPAVAHAVMARHGATLLLLCPGLSESTVYASEAPKGFYRQLVTGRVPAWLDPVPLPANSPYLLWRRVG